MERKIIVYGHGDKSEKGFPTEGSLHSYLGGGLFRDWGGRYQFSQQKKADIIVVSRDGFAFGHLDVESMEPPNESDRQAYPPAKQVYVIAKSVLYARTVRLLDLGISGYQFGKYITEKQFEKIQGLSGGCEEFPETTDNR